MRASSPSNATWNLRTCALPSSTSCAWRAPTSPPGRTPGAGPRWRPPVRRRGPDGVVHAVPVDQRPRHRPRVAHLDRGRPGRPVLQEAGGAVPRRDQGVGQVQGSRHHRGRRRSRHRICDRTPHAAARPLRRHREAALHQPCRSARPHRGDRSRGCADASWRRAPVDGTDVHRGVGQPRRPGRHVSSIRSLWWKSPSTSLVMRLAGGVIRYSCTEHVPTCLHVQCRRNGA